MFFLCSSKLVTDRRIVTAVFDYRLHQSIIDNQFFDRVSNNRNRFTPLKWTKITIIKNTEKQLNYTEHSISLAKLLNT